MGTLTLNQYQQLFSQAAHRADHESPHSRLVSGITPGGSLTSPDSLEVYRRGFIVRLTEALGDMYESVWWVSGDEDFFRLAKIFILSQPSHTYNLSSYGHEFPEFLEKERPFPDFPFLPDLARFEWLFKNIFHTQQHESVSQESIQHNISQGGNIFFKFGSSVHVFSARFAVYDIWKLRGTCHDEAPSIEWDREQYLLLYKKDDQIFVNELDHVEYTVLQQLLDGSTLEESLNSAATQFPDLDQQQISKLFQIVVHTGIIRHLSTTPDTPGAM